MINDDDNNNDNNYFIIITCIIIYTIVLTSYIFWTKTNNNKIHDSEFFDRCALTAFSQHKTILLKKKNNIRPYFNLA